MLKNESIQTKEYFAKYRQEHRKELGEYYRWYYSQNPEMYRKAFDKYRKTDKGKEAIERYEKSDKRRIAKKFYMRKYRAKIKKEKSLPHGF